MKTENPGLLKAFRFLASEQVGWISMDATLGMPLHSAFLRTIALCYYLVFGSIGDAILIIAWVLWKKRALMLDLIEKYTSDNVLKSTAVATIALILFWTARLFGRNEVSSQWRGPAKPMLFPCMTTHSRMFPKKHSFSYSYLMVGVPVGWEGAAGGMVSTSRSRKGWYHVDAADYLERGGGDFGLRGKLDAFLKSQGADPSHYPYAYLITAAKFLGYQFNPVSFWYLYSAEKDLVAAILEVNNTFGERRMYYLPPDDQATQIISENCSDGTYDTIKNLKKGSMSKPLRRAWPKDFHVSPFNSRKGGYSLIAHDPLAPMMEGSGSINNTINLTSSKDHAKLVARVFSEGSAIDPANMSAWHKLRFLSAWWWVGFITFPRIVKEAAALFFKRKLHVWYRPEPLKQSMGRLANDTERQLESVFRKYLRHLVNQCSAALTVRYIPSGVADVGIETMMSPTSLKESDSGTAEVMEFKVLTPAFYSRFVYYAHDLEAVFCELNDNCTIWVSRPDLLPKLIFKKPSPPLHISSWLDYGYFKLIQRFRYRPERIETLRTSSQAPARASTHTKTDIRDFRLSSMDGFVLSQEDLKSRKIYRSLVLKLFIAEKVAIGSMDLLWLEQFAVRALLAWLLI